jgi:hypothetical protein
MEVLLVAALQHIVVESRQHSCTMYINKRTFGSRYRGALRICSNMRCAHPAVSTQHVNTGHHTGHITQASSQRPLSQHAIAKVSTLDTIAPLHVVHH